MLSTQKRRVIMNNKEKVILFTIYDEGNIDDSYLKEENLKKYCEDKDYEVIKIFRVGASYITQSFSEVVYKFLKMTYEYRKLDFELFGPNFAKIVCYDLEEFCSRSEEIITLATIVKDNDIKLETIMQGIIGKNLTYTTMINEDVKNEIKENEEFVVEDAPF